LLNVIRLNGHKSELQASAKLTVACTNQSFLYLGAGPEAFAASALNSFSKRLKR